MPLQSLPFRISDYEINAIRCIQSPSVLYDGIRAGNDDGTDATAVTCKILSLSNISSWNDIDNLKYEAQLLQRLRHASIPTYVDFLQHETKTDCLYILITSPIKGIALQHYIDTLKQPLIPIESLLVELLDCAAYLSTLLPSVAHGNINTDNVFVELPNTQDITSNELRITLLNFSPSMDNTPIQPVPGDPGSYSDLYATAITVLSFITAKPPDAFPYMPEYLVPDLSELLPLSLTLQSPKMYSTLTRLLHPVPLHRLQTATDALEFFYMPSYSPSAPSPVVSSNEMKFLSSTRDDVSKTLVVRMHPRGITSSTIFGTMFSILWTGLSLSVTFSPNPATTLASRIISSAFALTGYPILTSTWAQRTFQSTLFFTVCPVQQSVYFFQKDCSNGNENTVNARSNSGKGSNQYVINLTFNQWLNCSIQVSRQSTDRDEPPSQTLVLSDSLQYHQLLSPLLSPSEMSWFQQQVNQFLNFHISQF